MEPGGFMIPLWTRVVGNNVAGWQWIVAVMPYFRIFHPVLQSQKFDPQGRYIKTWVEELKGCPVERIHNPHFTLLSSEGFELWPGYPKPMVDYKFSRQRALKVYKAAFHRG